MNDEVKLVKIWVVMGNRMDNINIAPTATINDLRGQAKLKLDLHGPSSGMAVKLSGLDTEPLDPTMPLHILLRDYADKLKRDKWANDPILYVTVPPKPEGPPIGPVIPVFIVQRGDRRHPCSVGKY